MVMVMVMVMVRVMVMVTNRVRVTVTVYMRGIKLCLFALVCGVVISFFLRPAPGSKLETLREVISNAHMGM
jgi:hypothetical protein